MSRRRAVAEIYELGKFGKWAEVLEHFSRNPAEAGECVRYVKPSSGWTLLHQAAYWGNREAAAACVQYGGGVKVVGKNGKTPIDVARSQNHMDLGDILNRAAREDGSCWAPVLAKPHLRASSNSWNEATRHNATHNFQVGYGGGEVNITAGDTYYTDSLGRVLVGWHGTYSPPRGMDGESMLD